MNQPSILAAGIAVAFALAGCGKSQDQPASGSAASSAPAPAPAPATTPDTTGTPSTTAPAAGQVAAAPATAASAAAVQAAATTVATAGGGAGATTYQQACIVCHGAGVAGAPKLGDKADWGPRIAQGEGLLYQHAIQGYTGQKGMMPPKGGNAALADADVRAAVDFMVAQSK